MTMRKIDVIVPHERLIEINEVIHKHRLGGMTFYNIKGRGRSKLEPVDPNKGILRLTPEFQTRIKCEMIVSVWPDTKVRLARTTEAIQIIKKLWNEAKKRDNGFVNFKGEYFSIKNAKLYTPPHSDNIPLYMAAVGPEAIKIAALHCDGLITVTKADHSREILDQFNKSAKDAGKDPFSLEKIAKPKYVTQLITIKHSSI